MRRKDNCHLTTIYEALTNIGKRDLPSDIFIKIYMLLTISKLNEASYHFIKSWKKPLIRSSSYFWKMLSSDMLFTFPRHYTTPYICEMREMNSGYRRANVGRFELGDCTIARHGTGTGLRRQKDTLPSHITYISSGSTNFINPPNHTFWSHLFSHRHASLHLCSPQLHAPIFAYSLIYSLLSSTSVSLRTYFLCYLRVPAWVLFVVSLRENQIYSYS